MTGIEIAAIAGVVIAAAGAAVSGIQQSNMNKYNAKVAKNNAISAQRIGRAEEMKQRRDAYRRMGAMRAAYGAAGVNLTGSPIDILADSAMEEELDALTIRYNYNSQAQGYQSQSMLDRRRAQSALYAGGFEAGTTLLTGGAGVYSSMAAKPTTTNRSGSAITLTP